MGRVPELTVEEHGGQQTYIWANSLRDDYISQTDTELQQYTFRDRILSSDGQEYANTAAGLNAAIQAAPTEGAEIIVPRDFNAGATQIVVNKNRISLKGQALLQSNSDLTPYIGDLIIDAAAAGVGHVQTEGFTLHKLTLNAVNPISYVDVKGCSLRSGATRNAVVCTGASHATHVTFTKCGFHDYTTNFTGCIRFESAAVGWGQIYFNNCTYEDHANNVRPVVFAEDAQVDSLWFNQFSCVIGNTGVNVFSFDDDSKVNVFVNDGLFEIHEDTTLFRIIAATTGGTTCVEFDNNEVSCVGSTTVTLINNTNGNWVNTRNGLTMIGGEKMGGGTLNLGTPNESTDFRVMIDMVRNWCEMHEVIAGAGWANPTGPTFEGRRVVMDNVGAGAWRSWWYIDGGWHYVALT